MKNAFAIAIGTLATLGFLMIFGPPLALFVLRLAGAR